MSFILLMLALIDTVNKDTIVIRSESFFIHIWDICIWVRSKEYVERRHGEPNKFLFLP